MNAAHTEIWNKYKNLFISNVNEEINFFKKPLSLETIVNGAIASLTQISDTLIEKLKISNNTDINQASVNIYVKFNENAINIIKTAQLNQDDNFLTSIINSCQNINLQDASTITEIKNDFNTVVDNIKFVNINDKYNEIDFMIFSLYFANYILFLVIDLIKNSEIPSLYRSNYLQNLIRTFVAYAKQHMKKIGVEFSSILSIINSMITVDSLIISVVGSSYYYLLNRKKMQSNSLDSTNALLADISCSPIISESIDFNVDVSIISDINLFNINDCENIDDDETPSMPYMDDSVSCETQVAPPLEINPIAQPDLITKAIIENKTNRKFVPSVNIKSYVKNTTKIASLDSSIIYSPVEGYVVSLSNNKIYVDVVDNDETALSSTVSKLNSNYSTLFDIIDFVKKYDVYLSYPLMLSNPGILVNPKIVGIRALHEIYYVEYKNILTTYDAKIQDISKYENIKPFLEANNVVEIKNKIDNETLSLLNTVKTYNNNAIDSRHNTIPIPTDYELFDYYISLLTQLNISPSLTEIEKTLKNKLTEFTEKRYVLEKNKESNLKNLINLDIKTLEKGISLGNYFDKIYEVYKKNGRINEVLDYLKGLSNKNGKLSQTEKDDLINSIMYLFNFWLSTSSINKKYTTPIGSIIGNLKIEYEWIKTFLDGLWSDYSKLQDENASIQSYLKSLDYINGYTITEEDGVKYKNYSISDSTNCDKQLDPITKPDASNDVYTLKYWIKYFSYVTLVGAADIISWSTGIILPSGPLKLPVIYVPIAPIKTDYGFIVIGLTICGIYIYPFITYNNVSSSAKSIIAPGLSSIKDEIKSIKDEINNSGITLTSNVINPILQNIKDELQPLKAQISDLRAAIKDHQKNKPVPGVKNTEALTKWDVQAANYTANYTALNMKKFKLQSKYKMLKDFKTTGKLGLDTGDNEIKKINSIKKSTSGKIDKLSLLLDNLDKILSNLPTALRPNSVNFGMTLKNPKPVIEIKTNTNEGINDVALNTIFNKQKKIKESLMDKNFKETSSSNLKNYYKIIKSSTNLIITNEPYPTYDRIMPSNLGFLSFTKTFVEKGSKTFGIPGQLPLP